MNIIAEPRLHARAGRISAQPTFIGMSDSLTGEQQAVLLTCRHLVRHKYRELMEWCQRVKTDYIEVMVTLTDIRLFHDGLTPQDFVTNARKMKNGTGGKQMLFPVLDASLIASIPDLLSIKFSWEVFNWLSE